MLDSVRIRRSVVVTLIAVVLTALPVVPSWAAGDESASAQALPVEEGLLQQVIDWLLEAAGVATSSEPDDTSDSGGGFDPMG